MIGLTEPAPRPTGHDPALRRLAAHAARLAAGLAAGIAEGLSRRAVNGRVLRKLSVMTERELKDIGLVRQDVADAGASGEDASLFLLARRDERRAARRREDFVKR